MVHILLTKLALKVIWDEGFCLFGSDVHCTVNNIKDIGHLVIVKDQSCHLVYLNIIMHKITYL